MQGKDLRIIFMGTPDFAVVSLKSLVEGGYNVVAAITTPDKPAGRGLKLQQSAVKQYAEQAGIPVLQPEKLKSEEFISQLKDLAPDLGIVIAFRMLPEIVWSLPRMGTFNLHASLLPQYRGAAPINRAIMNGETTTGVTTFMLNSGMDQGDILGRRKVEIADDDNAGTLHDKLAQVGSELVLQTVDDIASGKSEPQAQPEDGKEIQTAPKIFREDCLIRWDRTPGEIYNFVRGLSPYPAAWAYLKQNTQPCVVEAQNVEGETLKSSSCPPCAQTEPISVKILACRPEESGHSDAFGRIDSDGKKFLRVACRGGWIYVEKLQPAGRRAMSAEEFLRGTKNIEAYGF